MNEKIPAAPGAIEPAATTLTVEAVSQTAARILERARRNDTEAARIESKLREWESELAERTESINPEDAKEVDLLGRCALRVQIAPQVIEAMQRIGEQLRGETEALMKEAIRALSPVIQGKRKKLLVNALASLRPLFADEKQASAAAAKSDKVVALDNAWSAFTNLQYQNMLGGATPRLELTLAKISEFSNWPTE